MNANFEKLIQRTGGYCLPYLIYLHDKTKSIEMRFVNNTEEIVYEDEVYTPGTFSYKPRSSELGFDGGGTLQIGVADNSVIDLIESGKEIFLEVVGLLVDEEVTKINTFSHHYGTISGDRLSIKFTFERDDRLGMTFPALIWSTQNNRGNS